MRQILFISVHDKSNVFIELMIDNWMYNVKKAQSRATLDKNSFEVQLWFTSCVCLWSHYPCRGIVTIFDERLPTIPFEATRYYAYLNIIQCSQWPCCNQTQSDVVHKNTVVDLGPFLPCSPLGRDCFHQLQLTVAFATWQRLYLQNIKVRAFLEKKRGLPTEKSADADK